MAKDINVLELKVNCDNLDISGDGHWCTLLMMIYDKYTEEVVGDGYRCMRTISEACSVCEEYYPGRCAYKFGITRSLS